jgi:hypothetical protein
MEGVATFGKTRGRETLGACAEGDELRAACTRVVQREAGQHGVLSGLRGEGQEGVLRKGGGHDAVDRGGHGGVRVRAVGLLHDYWLQLL